MGKWTRANKCARWSRDDKMPEMSTNEMVTVKRHGRAVRGVVSDGCRGDGDEREWWC